MIAYISRFLWCNIYHVRFATIATGRAINLWRNGIIQFENQVIHFFRLTIVQEISKMFILFFMLRSIAGDGLKIGV